jgi:hypothetical protein
MSAAAADTMTELLGRERLVGLIHPAKKVAQL